MEKIVDKVYEDIKSMRIRGALDIAIAAAETLGKVVLSDLEDITDAGEFIDELYSAGEKLKSARPSAVSLPNAVNYIMYSARKNINLELGDLKKKLSEEICRFVEEQNNALETIAEIGSRLIEDGDVVMTHCNSDTVVLLLKRAWDEGKKIEVFCTETRPRYQGHLTAKELSEHGIPTTMSVDSAAHLFMREMKVDKVIVGSDTVYANGDAINKIGTSQIAICAKDMNIDFIVATESLKFCPQSLLGSRVDIEYRSPSEIIDVGKLPNVKILNPAFDVTAADYISVFITEFGVIPPEAIYHLLREKFGWEFEF